MSVFLSACLYTINVKRLNRLGPNFVRDLTRPHGKVYGCSKLQKFVSKSFENAQKNVLYPRTFFVIVFVQREDGKR